MARIGDAGNGLPAQTPLGNSTYDVNVRASDPAYQEFGASQRTARQIEDYLSQADSDFQNGSFMQMLNTSPNRGDGTSGVFAAQQAIFSTDITIGQKTAQKKYEAVASFGFDSWASEFYKPVDTDSMKYFTGTDNFGDKFDNRQAPAVSLSDIPTSSTNSARPRTVAAGYDPEQKTITVVFRDGTFWNYYNVPESVWIKFHQAYSKGPLLNNPSSKQASKGDLLNYENGPADPSSLSPTAQEFLYRAVRTAQIYYADRPTKERTRIKKGKGASGTAYGTSQNPRSKQSRNLQAAYNAVSTAKAKARASRNPSNGGKNPFQK